MLKDSTTEPIEIVSHVHTVTPTLGAHKSNSGIRAELVTTTHGTMTVVTIDRNSVIAPSSHAPFHLVQNGPRYPTLEHCYYAHKVACTFPKHQQDDTIELFMGSVSESTSEVRAMATTITKQWDDADYSTWANTKCDIIVRAMRAQCDANPQIRCNLLDTLNSCILYSDKYCMEHGWTAGKNCMGDNIIGLQWMRVRNEFNTLDGKTHFKVIPTVAYEQLKHTAKLIGPICLPPWGSGVFATA